MQDFYIFKDSKADQRHKVFETMNKYILENSNTRDLHIRVKDHKKSPSDEQRKYLRGIICGMALKAMEDLGNEGLTNEDVYRLLKERGKFCKEIIVVVKGRELKRIVYETFSNKGNKEQMMKFIEFSIKWCALYLNIVIPSPEDFGIIEEKKK